MDVGNAVSVIIAAYHNTHFHCEKSLLLMIYTFKDLEKNRIPKIAQMLKLNGVLNFFSKSSGGQVSIRTQIKYLYSLALTEKLSRTV